jgi:hypothetical protein
MKLKLSCLLSVCLLMGSCSGGTSGNVSDSGTSAYPSSNPGYTSSNPSTPTYTPSTSGSNSTINPSVAAANLQRLMNNQARSNSTIGDTPSQVYTNLGNSIRQQGCSYNAAGDWVC